jgi:hypothetical protein
MLYLSFTWFVWGRKLQYWVLFLVFLIYAVQYISTHRQCQFLLQRYFTNLKHARNWFQKIMCIICVSKNLFLSAGMHPYCTEGSQTSTCCRYIDHKHFVWIYTLPHLYPDAWWVWCLQEQSYHTWLSNYRLPMLN